MASKKRRPQPGGGCGASEKVLAGGFDFSKDKHPHRISQAIPETEAEALAYGEAQPTGAHLAEARALWWRQAALGHRLPAEACVILLTGGRP